MALEERHKVGKHFLGPDGGPSAIEQAIDNDGTVVVGALGVGAFADAPHNTLEELSWPRSDPTLKVIEPVDKLILKVRV